MLADPQSITVNSVAQSLPTVSRGSDTSTYRSADEAYSFTISHQYGKRRRRLISLDHKKVAADPLSAVNAQVSAGFRVVIDEPLFGYSDAELKDILLGLTAWLTSANVLKVVAGES
jgi:hypothetical protein